ncbi:helix-turn-helix domain-containing protein [Nocardia sp. CDC186]|uniref:Helix-turn-helix domain-containing protein n=1 Tax=Nocardia implantans TaxID=3108168 RepID=A0ABU6AUZ0_9NOCA|nr:MULTISPECIES: helix-turn-helix domain-containing protein [unclassified Nocardia]MBF6192605.1 helix-turn-helix transcriptional regulator [Nocardia beijingensis]MEA3527488.1 helix-turn-helix domain-containing protein [Nocardia sp. CDC192]MEB3511196.1 helix-turn-helix domain-containing protein [Nocardia sp. CDC186]
MDTVCDRPAAGNLVDNYLHHCPAREVLTVLADKWVMLVLGVLRGHDGPIRFNELRRRLDGITQKMLTRTLRDLEREGLVRRAVYPTVPPRVEYSLTEMGASIGAITHAMGVWAVEHQDRILAARADFDARAAAVPEPVTSGGSR